MADNSEVLQQLSEERRNLDKPEGKRRDNAVKKAADQKLAAAEEASPSAAPEPPNAPVGGAENKAATTKK
jgi:hypothetical protein